MKKILSGFILICIIFLLAISCNPNFEQLREVEGKIMRTQNANLFGIDGTIVVWSKRIRPAKQGKVLEEHEFKKHNKWFLYPPLSLTITENEYTTVRLMYNLLSMSTSVPIVKVVRIKKIN